MSRPIRSKQHVSESVAVRAIERCLPEHWIFRHVTERDYGMDCIVEIVEAKEKDFQLSGEVFAVQAKGVKTLRWKADPRGGRIARLAGIKSSTVNYWMKLPMPVFLCIHEAESDRVYFIDIKRFIRRNNPILGKAKSVSFTLQDDLCLNEDVGVYILLRLFKLESSFESFAEALLFLLTHQQTFEMHRELQRQRDPNAETTDEALATLMSFLKACRTVSYHLFEEWNGPTAWSIQAREGPGPYERQMLESTLAAGYEDLAGPYQDLIAGGRHLVTVLERNFWLFRDPFLVRACYLPEQREEIQRRRREWRARGL